MINPRLLSVSFMGTEVTDADLACLEHLPDLRVLDLSRTGITDAGLVHVKGLAKLEELELDGTRVTDAGLAHLMGLTNLKKLRLQNTQVTERGAKEILQALPIEDYYGPPEVPPELPTTGTPDSSEPATTSRPSATGSRL